jgi:hypothetical protein
VSLWCCSVDAVSWHVHQTWRIIVSATLTTLWTTVGGCRAAVGVLMCEGTRHGTQSLWRRIMHGYLWPL